MFALIRSLPTRRLLILSVIAGAIAIGVAGALATGGLTSGGDLVVDGQTLGIIFTPEKLKVLRT